MTAAIAWSLALLLPVSLAAIEMPGEQPGDLVRYELAVAYGETGRLALTVVKEDRAGEFYESWDLSRADSFLPPDLRETGWMVFRGRKRAHAGEEPLLRRDLWLIVQKKGLWYAGSVARRVETRGGVFVLEVVRPDEKGQPRLVYVHETTRQTLERKPDRLDPIRKVTFQPPVQE